MAERWKDVVGTDGRYQVSSEGRVRTWTHIAGRKGPGYRAPEPREVTVYPKDGRPAVCMAMRHGDKQRDYYVARLMLEAFVGPPKGRQAEFIDGDALTLSNLRWAVAGAAAKEAARARRAEERAQREAEQERVAEARRKDALRRLAGKDAKVEDGERWLPVRGYEGRYEVSDQGRVRSLVKGEPRLLAMRTSNRGRVQVPLTKDGKKRMLLAYRLMLEAFVGPCPPGHEASHLDGDKTNNALANLAWETPERNRSRGWVGI